MKKELKSGILSADKSADCQPTVGGVNVIAVLYINNWVKRKMRVLHWPQGRVAGLHVCKKGMQHSLTVACTCVIDN